MKNELTAVLKEIASLLRRQLEQHDSIRERADEVRQQLGQRRDSFRQGGEARREQMESRMANAREQSAEYRRGERELKERLLAQLERHNQLLEQLVARLGNRL
jgi:hypothetical protein